ncbi:hypothetical protein ACIQUM_06980 [Amycolatopsis azurea]|uniref:hypothetical protein n=1 Tax=Amycolatopsis azurea TaxID=36819 RepID=UPI003800030B
MDPTLPEKALATLAMIEANSSPGRTHIDNFIPFALEIMRQAPDDPMLANDVSLGVQERFALRIPTQVMESVLKRATRTGSLVRQHKKYSLSLDSRSGLKNLQIEQQQYIREQNNLRDKFIDFCRDRHSIDLTEDQAEKALYDQIESNTVALLSSSISGTEYTAPRKIDAEHNYLAADFIAHVTRADQAAYTWLVAAAKGAMLSVFLHLPNSLQVERRFSNTTLFLDAPLLLQLAGLEGPESKESVLEVVRLAREYGAEIAAFTHSVREAEGVLFASIETRKRGNRLPDRSDGVLGYVIRADISASELEARTGRFSDDLSAMSVKIVDKSDSIYKIEIDEVQLAEELRKKIKYRYEGALNKDIDSLRGVHFIRRGHSSVYIENCKAVLITGNEAVARVAQKFFRNEGYDWPVASLISDLGTILYLKEPQKAPNMPRIQLSAGAYSALEPGPIIWSKWLEAIERQQKSGEVSVGDIALLCHTQESRRILMEFTLGKAENVDVQTVHQVLDETKRRVAEPAVKRANEYELESIKANAQAQVALSKAEEATDKNVTLASQLADMQRRLEKFDSDAKARENELSEKAHRFAVKVIRICLITVSAIFVTLAIVATLANSLDFMPKWLAILATAALGLIFGLGGLRHFFGGSVKDWLKPIEKRIFKRRLAHLNKLISVKTEAHQP